MRVKKLIPVHGIKMDRTPLNPTTLALIDFLRAGGEVPAIKVAHIGGTFEIRDGRHRVTAFKLLGRPAILAHWGYDHLSMCPCEDCSRIAFELEGAKRVKNNQEGSDLPKSAGSTSDQGPPLQEGEDGW